tara:strand:- start:8214 stop:9437 length:1224 start_codon:yes stop_codon:yes gene_type:complete
VNQKATSSEKLLEGLTVLDFTRVFAGPYCTRMLADLGARVIKVERPGEGDEIRRVVLQLEEGKSDQSSYFVRLNSGKEGIAVNLSHPESHALILDLIEKSDVLVENFSPGIMARYGLDSDTLRSQKPDLIYCSISGFGQTGPLSSMKAYAHLINAVSGLMDLDRGGERDPGAQYLQVADVLAGTHAFGAISAALLRRSRTGEGATLDISMMECLIASDDISYPSLLNGGTAHHGPRPGMLVTNIGDRYMAIQTAISPSMWSKMVKFIGQPELETDPRFSTTLLRRENWDALSELLSEWLKSFEDVDKAIAAITEAGLPGAPMLTPEEVIDHPHLKEREAFPKVDHPGRGKVRVTATPFFVDGNPTHPKGAAPYRIGEQTHKVISEFLGYTDEKIATLHEAEVIDIPH